VEPLQIEDLYTLEAYATLRPEFRARVMAHKQHRRLLLGDHVVLLFEDRLTIQYQVQEMLRIERIFEEDGIREELGAFNPLVPNGTNWKATMMIEYTDPGERQAALERLVGIEDLGRPFPALRVDRRDDRGAQGGAITERRRQSFTLPGSRRSFPTHVCVADRRSRLSAPVDIPCMYCACYGLYATSKQFEPTIG